MKSLRAGVFPVLILLALTVAACSSAAAFADRQAMSPPAVLSTTATSMPLGVTSTPRPDLTPSPAAATAETPAITEAAPPGRPSPTPDQPGFPATPCAEETCIYPAALPLGRPIAPPGRQAVEASYRFGSTQGGARDPHHGVEFLNPLGTPVLAAAGGQVVFAGDDQRTLLGPYYNFYGNVVVLAHDVPGLEESLYTLYAHLSEVLVESGAEVKAGEEIGRVGLSGVATGSHLHFEVRLGSNDYRSVRNPELWLTPLTDENGEPGGALAVRILAPPGVVFKISNAVVERLSGPDGVAMQRYYLDGYQERALVGQPPWEEYFALGDLAPGWYRVSFVQYGIQTRQVEVQSGALTVASFDLSGDE